MRVKSGGAILARVAGLVLLFAAAPALAETQTTATPPPVAKGKDPNRIICEKVEDTGSRLSTSRICLTAQQWEEKRRTERENLEQVQRGHR